MRLCLDIGNSQIYGGVFDNDNLQFQFRRSSKSSSSSDELGVFLRSVLRENNVDPEDIAEIAICTVVPEFLHSLKNACRKYFQKTPFILQAGVKTGLNIRYLNPLELGADRIANAIAGVHLFPKQNLIIIDLGTATTFCAINSNKEFLGGTIIPGLRISMSALETNTSKLPTVEILPMENALAKSTIEGIQAGLYLSNIGAMKEICSRLKAEAFKNEQALVIGTGGFASMFTDAGIFNVEIPDLVLKGLNYSYKMNASKSGGRSANQHAQI